MSPRIAYWTSAYDPDMEAIAGEVALLRRRFSASAVWGLNPSKWLQISNRRGYFVNPKLHVLFRFATRLLEPLFQINHVFGSLGDWFYLHGVRRRPTIITVATNAPPVAQSLLDRVDRFVIECPSGRAQLIAAGVNAERIRLILPPVDLKRFAVAPPPSGPFTILFASSPDQDDWLAARGVPLLLEAAAIRPQFHFRLLWRPWGNSEARVRQWVKERHLTNVEILTGRITDMSRYYQDCHVTAVPYTDISRCKSAPNSMIESLACGRPVVLTDVVGLAGLVRDESAGLICEQSAHSIAECLDRIQMEWNHYSGHARSLAERSFGCGRFLTSYQELYDEVIRENAA